MAVNLFISGFLLSIAHLKVTTMARSFQRAPNDCCETFTFVVIIENVFCPPHITTTEFTHGTYSISMTDGTYDKFRDAVGT